MLIISKYKLTLSFFLILFSSVCFSQNLTPFKVDNLWGYKNSDGKIKIEPQYQYASKFIFGTLIVVKMIVLLQLIQIII